MNVFFGIFVTKITTNSKELNPVIPSMGSKALQGKKSDIGTKRRPLCLDSRVNGMLRYLELNEKTLKTMVRSFYLIQ